MLMAVISRISVQKKRLDRYNIFITDKYAFSVDEEVLIKFDLKKGKELDEFDLADIQMHDDIQKAFTQSLHYLSHRMRSESEVRMYLRKKEVDDAIIQEAIHKLYHYKYLDDLEFARAFVRTHANGGNKGPIVIRQELKEKGISEKLIEKAILEYPIDLQIEHARQQAEKSIKKEKNLSERSLQQKLDQVLMRKGYPRDIIVAALQEVTVEKDSEEEWNSLIYHGEKLERRYKAYQGFEYEQKMKQALFRKGFPMELISRYLDRDEYFE